AVLVPLAGAEYAFVPPPRTPPHRVRWFSPFPLPAPLGVGLSDESSDPGERLAPPIAQLLDSRMDQLRGRVSSLSFLRGALPLHHNGVPLFMVARPSPRTYH